MRDACRSRHHPPHNGRRTGKHHRSASAYAKNSGLDVHLISGPTTGPEGSLASSFAASEQAFTLLPDLIRPLHPWKDAIAGRQLARIFRETRPDIVHTHSGKAGFLGRIAARRSAGVPIIIHTIHGPSLARFKARFPISFSLPRNAAPAKSQLISFQAADAMTRQYLPLASANLPNIQKSSAAFRSLRF